MVQELKNPLPRSLSGIIRCRDCKHFKLGTIAKPGCYKLPGQRHPLNKACKDFEPKPVPVKKEYKIPRPDFWVRYKKP
jgi:hypothetical protein